MTISSTKFIDIFLPDLRGGGAERVCLNLANEFARRGFPVRMVLMQVEGELLPLLDSHVRVVDLGDSRVRNVLWPLVRHLRKAPPAALLANMWPLTFLAVLASKLARVGCRVVAVEHTNWAAASVSRSRNHAMVFKASMRWLRPRVDALLAVSAGAARALEHYVNFPKGSVAVQHNPVVKNSAYVSAAGIPALAWLAGGHKRLLVVGTLSKIKALPILLRAFALLRGRVDARLLILGEGDERVMLESLVRQLGLEDSVEIPGFVIDPAPYYAQADLYVLSSSHEGLPTVIIEALDYGIPVVSTDCPSGPREILENGKYGTLVQVGDIEAMALAMQESLQSTHDHAALKARARDFAVDKIANQYLDHLLPGWRAQASEHTS